MNVPTFFDSFSRPARRTLASLAFAPLLLCLAGCPYATFENPVFEMAAGADGRPTLQEPDARLEGVWRLAHDSGVPPKSLPRLVRVETKFLREISGPESAAWVFDMRVQTVEFPNEESSEELWKLIALAVNTTIGDATYLDLEALEGEGSKIVAKYSFDGEGRLTLRLPVSEVVLRLASEGKLSAEGASVDNMRVTASTEELRAFLKANPNVLYPDKVADPNVETSFTFEKIDEAEAEAILRAWKIERGDIAPAEGASETPEEDAEGEAAKAQGSEEQAE